MFQGVDYLFLREPLIKSMARALMKLTTNILFSFHLCFQRLPENQSYPSPMKRLYERLNLIMKAGITTAGLPRLVSVTSILISVSSLVWRIMHYIRVKSYAPVHIVTSLTIIQSTNEVQRVCIRQANKQRSNERKKQTSPAI